ncbi:efflux RND transporter periplasmic adaptor subunit [Sphingomonas arenae]|uniref:efflux RND transporter periplasmic adaptor subunit n=1 Tax=Sphingomonas arenae TaxID=2812555 RepID=UPI0019670917
MRIRPAWVIVILVILAAAAGAWWWTQRPVEVTGTRPTIGPAMEVIYATGFVEPRRPVEVSSRITAPVVELYVEEGQRVTPGQPLVRLDDVDQRQTIAQLAAQTRSAEQDEGRTLALYRQGFASAAARDRVVTAAQSARAAEAAAWGRLAQFTIRASIPGVVLRREVEPGDLATPSRTLFQIGDPALLRVTATVDERDIPRVRAGAEAIMSSDAYPGRTFKGRVYEVTPGGDPSQRSFRVRIAPDPGVVLPVGLTLEVNIVSTVKHGALLLPANAIKGGKVWAVDDGRARQIDVRAGVEGAEKTEVVRGLSRASCVIVAPPDGLADGRRIQVSGC